MAASDLGLTDQLVALLNTNYVEGVPVYHLIIEAAMFLMVIKLLFFSSKYKAGPNIEKLTAKEEDDLVNSWSPEPLVKPAAEVVQRPERVIDGMAKTSVTINGKEKLNFASFNFLGLVGDDQIQDVSVKAAKHYGIGSCGPRGFYGTIDVHLALERKLAAFMGAEQAIMYAYGFSTIASVIPAYCKRGDVIFYDEGVSFATQKGLIASRSRLVAFKHNDMEDLTRLLEEQAESDRKDPTKAQSVRRFMVAEGLYQNYGDIAPLDKLVDLKFKYKVRLFLEESASFGVLGKTGRGVTEHFGISVDKIDAIAASMGNALASIGGFCVGRTYVIDHQVLSGAGYCYSASLPPLLAKAALEALEIIDDRKDLQQKLVANARQFRSDLRTALAAAKCDVSVGGWEDSPLVHLRVEGGSTNDEADATLDAVVEEALGNGVAVTKAAYIKEEELHLPRPSIRISVSGGHTAKELTKAAKVVAAAFAASR